MIYLLHHERIGLAVCAFLIWLAVRAWRVGVKAERDLDRILGPERLDHVQRDRAWRRINP